MQIMGPGEIENRLAQLRRPANGFIDGIQPRNAAQKNLVPLGIADRKEHQTTE